MLRNQYGARNGIEKPKGKIDRLNIDDIAKYTESPREQHRRNGPTTEAYDLELANSLPQECVDRLLTLFDDIVESPSSAHAEPEFERMV